MGTVRIEGLSEFRNELNLLLRTAPEQLDQVNFAIAGIIAVEARRHAPHGIHQGGGLVVPIMASIKTQQVSGKAQIVVGGTHSPHAAVTEFGGRIPRRGFRGKRRSITRLRAIAHGAITHVRKQPYLYPAIESKSEDIKAKYMQMLDEWTRRLSDG